jgi:hypothetical protein
MPLVTPLQQSARAREIFSNTIAPNAAAASAAATPAVAALVDYCAANATDDSGNLLHLFNATNCPGLADLTANGTTAPWPTGAQVVKRYVRPSVRSYIRRTSAARTRVLLEDVVAYVR